MIGTHAASESAGTLLEHKEFIVFRRVGHGMQREAFVASELQGTAQRQLPEATHLNVICGRVLETLGVRFQRHGVHWFLLLRWIHLPVTPPALEEIERASHGE